MELIKNKYDCTGCSACRSICPKDAIKIKEDDKGFLYPKIIHSKCVDCGLCKKICPNIAKKEKENKELKIYAMKNKNEDIRKNSSSGGFFYEFAKIILKEKGVIYGAAYNTENEVEHIRVESESELKKLQGSKYIQSKIKNTYDEAIQDLKQGRKVLFSGTPCQINGLESLVKNKNIDKENLYTCDLICHGVPSTKVFKDYLKSIENKYNSKIVDINFRYKANLCTQNIKIKFENGEQYISNYLEGDEFYRLFLKDYILRESCYECKYTSYNRISDITIGDFWGIEKSIKDFDDKKGVSLVLVNTEKGKDIFEVLKDKFYIEETNRKNCVQDNLVKPRDRIENYDEMWENYIKYGYGYWIKKI